MEKFQELSVFVWTEELGCQSSNQNDCDWLNNKEWVNAGKEWDKVTVEQWAIMKIITQKEQPYDKETPLLGIYLEKTIIHKVHTLKCSLQCYLQRPEHRNKLYVH